MQPAELNAKATRRRKKRGRNVVETMHRPGDQRGQEGVYREDLNEVGISAHIGSCAVWSGREDLNLRPLRPERSALPGCATPRPGRTEQEFRIVLQQGGKTQAVRFSHSLAGHCAVHHIYTFGQTRIRTNRLLDTIRSEPDQVRQCGIG
jgi:hypothetical protein